MATEIRATVFTIESINSHSNADKLEVVNALGWQVVTAKGLHKVGDRCVYIQPDSLVPTEWAEKWGVKQYLKGPEQNRVGQIKLRGEPSFGFIVSVPEGDWKDGDNLAPFFNITKYEPPIKTTCGDAEKDHPLFQKYTDIENLRNFPDIFIPGEEIVATEKIHGCVHKDTMVMLANGEERAISDITPGTMILSFDEEKKEFVPAEVLEVLVQKPTQKIKWYELEFDGILHLGSKLVCTEDHPILTNRGWVKAADLTADDEIISVY